MKKIISTLLFITLVLPYHIYCEPKRLYCNGVANARELMSLDKKISSTKLLINSLIKAISCTQAELFNKNDQYSLRSYNSAVTRLSNERYNLTHFNTEARQLCLDSCKLEFIFNDFNFSLVVENWPFF